MTDLRNDRFPGYQWSLGNEVTPGPVWFLGTKDPRNQVVPRTPSTGH
jgi:hypothetical protein